MASNYEWVSYGSQGNAVKQVQQILNRSGYELEEDGVFGPLTRAAVLDYQKKNGLRIVDGIVGDETWGHMLSSQTAAPQPTASRQVLSGVSDETAGAVQALEQGFQRSDSTEQAYDEYEALRASAPGSYVSSFAVELAQLYDQIAGRQPFRYDPAEDAAYARYAAAYQRQGRAAMENTLGKAAALTGGYGSTYAETAAWDAYGSYLDKLADQTGALADNARKQYQQEGEALLERYKLLQQQEQAEYKRYREDYDAWRSDTADALKRAQTEENRDVTLYRQMLNYYADKLAAEQKAATAAASAAAKSSGSASSAKKSTASAAPLSQAAAESVSRVAKRYLASGNTEAAQALVTQYAPRMTLAQQQKLLGMKRQVK